MPPTRDDARLGPIGLRPIGAADCAEERLDVLALPGGVRGPDWAAVSDVERGLGRQLAAEAVGAPSAASSQARKACGHAILSRPMGILGINHIAFRTPDPDELRRFYLELTGAEALEGAHSPIRLGHTLLVFFQSPSTGAAADPDEIAFDVDSTGFEDVLERARRLGCEIRGPVEHTPSSRGFYLSDPDGRRLEFTHDDPGVYWRE
jgi:catechol 2,3-dioxygenase-like lactoylglutathione lyase family enzyme